MGKVPTKPPPFKLILVTRPLTHVTLVHGVQIGTFGLYLVQFHPIAKVLGEIVAAKSHNADISGSTVGATVGNNVGMVLGTVVGRNVGVTVGNKDGVILGFFVGHLEGRPVG